MRRALLVATASALGVLALAPSTQAATAGPVWQCRASVAYASVTGNNRVEPIVANGNINTADGASPDRAQCVNSETGAGNTATQLGIAPEFAAAVTGKAATGIVPELGRAIDQKIAAEGRVEDLTLPLGSSSIVLGIGAANAVAAAGCTPGNLTPQFAGDSRVADITLGGTPIPLDGLVKALSDALAPLGFLVEITPDERVADANSLTVRALHIKILRGTTPVVDLVVGEAKVAASGAVCDPAQQNDGDNGTDGPGGNGGGQICPTGSTLDVARTLCVIPAGSGGSNQGLIIVGRPFQGPSGGSVIPLDVARRRFPRAPCVKGGGPRFVVIGTRGNDRITGSNRADRILGLSGNDRLDGGRGNDCMEGNDGRDIVSGALGRDRVFGSAGNDALNGGGESDRLSGGTGNDTINAAFGRDQTFGGSGRDFINIATAGPPASASCGPGRGDKVRLNRNEQRRVRGCEFVIVFRERNG